MAMQPLDTVANEVFQAMSPKTSRIDAEFYAVMEDGTRTLCGMLPGNSFGISKAGSINAFLGGKIATPTGGRFQVSCNVTLVNSAEAIQVIEADRAGKAAPKVAAKK